MHLPRLRQPSAPALLRILLRAQSRAASSASHQQWIIRRANDIYKKADFLEYKNRAGVKLDQIQSRYRIFKGGLTVVDLGFAPGGWSEVALKHTGPRGRVVGVDVIPATPPRGVSTFQGDFRSPIVQAGIRKYLLDPERGRPQPRMLLCDEQGAESGVVDMERGYIDRERMMEKEDTAIEGEGGSKKTVDVVLSDMCEPYQRPATGKRSLDLPHDRMMATSGNKSKDHFGSMDLCYSALLFCIDVLKPNGTFVCKYYQGSEEKILQERMRMAFRSVDSYKPDASRQESCERYYICEKMMEGVKKEDIFPDERFMLEPSYWR